MQKMKTKQFLISLFFTFLLVTIGWTQSPQKLEIKVQNPTNFERNSETISLQWEMLTKKAPWLDSLRLIMSDPQTNNELITQLLQGDLLFQSNFKPFEVKTFVLFNSQSAKSAPQSLVDVRFVIPREDIAWENNRIAYRIYGSKLAGDVLSGIDVWVKRVRYHIIDKWYAGNSLIGKERISYHIDHGEGADFFTVGKSLGAGGCALWKNDKLCQKGLFNSYEILATGPIRTKFKVTYENDTINGLTFKEEKTYTFDAGENLNRIDAYYSGLNEKGSVSVAAGLVKRKNTEHFTDKNYGLLSLWGLVDDDSTNGYLGTGIVLPHESYQEMREDSDHYLIIGITTTDKHFTYFAGAGWTRSTDFDSVKDWNNYLKNFALRIRYPLQISVL
jgi:pectinesterase